MIVMHVIGSRREREQPWPGQPFSRLPDDYDWYGMPRQHVWRPPTDVYETDRHVVIKVEIAGMTKEDFHLSFADRRLVIAGRRKDPAGKLIYQNMEIRYGEFRTEIRVDWAVDPSAIEANYEEGFLFVMLPKEERRISVPIRERSES